MDDLDKIELTPEVATKLRERQGELIKIIEAFEGLEKNKDWQVIKELVFGRWLEAVERQMRNEVLSKEIDSDKLYKLQGEWASARQYSDPIGFAKTLAVQLQGIKNKLK